MHIFCQQFRFLDFSFFIEFYYLLNRFILRIDDERVIFQHIGFFVCQVIHFLETAHKFIENDHCRNIFYLQMFHFGFHGEIHIIQYFVESFLAEFFTDFEWNFIRFNVSEIIFRANKRSENIDDFRMFFDEFTVTFFAETGFYLVIEEFVENFFNFFGIGVIGSVGGFLLFFIDQIFVDFGIDAHESYIGIFHFQVLENMAVDDGIGENHFYSLCFHQI